MRTRLIRFAAAVGSLLAVTLVGPPGALAHCDTMDGPVVKEAMQALKTGDLTPVLKWVRPEDEAAIKAAFQQTTRVRVKGPEARDLADIYFFETVVRLHRAGEGEPYTGLKPAGIDPGPAVRAADQALETGAVEALVKMLTEEAAAGLRSRFAAALEKKSHAAHSVAAGREFVKAYVEFLHYAERLHHDATAAAAHHEAAAPAAPHHHEGGGK